jgi:hypothetical protein
VHEQKVDKQQVVFVEPSYCINVHGQKVWNLGVVFSGKRRGISGVAWVGTDEK